MSRKRARLVGAGLTAGALGAALLAAPEAAFAAPTTVGPPIVTVGNNATINDPAGIFSTNSVVQLSSAAACAGRPGTQGANGPWNATVGTKTSTSVAFTVPSGPVAGTNGVVKPYNICVYDSSITSTNVNSLQGGAVIYVGAPVMLSANSGVTGGGNQLTVTANPAAPIFMGANTVGAVFSTAPCPNTLGTTTAPNLTASNVARLSNTTVSLTVPPGVVTASGGAPTNYNLCMYDGSAATGGLLSFASYTANVVGLSPASGSSLISNGVTANSPMPFLSGVTTPAVLVIGPGGGCPGMYSTAPIGTVTPMPLNAPGAVRRLTNNRAAVTIPPLQLQPAGQPTNYQLCFYANSTATGSLLGTATYAAAIVAAPTAVIPAAGPSSGGNTITVVGSDFPTDPGRITATLGGAPLTNIQPVSDKAFTAVAPPHPVEDNVTLVVTTSAGTKALTGAYSYLNPIKVSPNTAPGTAPFVDVDVQGSGFMGINFGTAASSGRAYLVNGVYNGAETTSGARANGPVAECVNVLPISDEELVCTIQLNRRLNAQGTDFFDPVAYSNTPTDIATTAGSRVITSAAGKFSPNDVDQPIVQATAPTNIPAGSLVTSVLSPMKAVISQPSPQTGNTITATIGGGVPAHVLTGALTTTTGSTMVTLTSGAFNRADIGRVFNTTTGVPSGTTILSVAPGGQSATLSVPATATTTYSLAQASITGGTSTLNSTALVAGDVGAMIGANPLGIPPGTTISGVTGATATLSASAIGGGGPADITLNKPVAANLFAAAPVPDGAYNLVVVSNSAPDAANTDPDYFQTDVTSGSTFTVASF